MHDSLLYYELFHLTLILIPSHFIFYYPNFTGKEIKSYKELVQVPVANMQKSCLLPKPGHVNTIQNCLYQ
jgi:hypothetical protein